MQNQIELEEDGTPSWKQIVHSGQIPILVFLLSCILIGTGIFILMQKENGTLQEIRVNGNRYLSREDVLSLSGVTSGLYINDDVVNSVRERLEGNRFIREARVEFEDGILNIEIEDPECVLIAASDSVLYDVDMGLNVLGSDPVRCSDSPVVRGSFGVRDGRITDARMIEVGNSLIRIKKTMPELFARISEIELKGQKRATLFITTKRIRIELLGDLSESNVKRLYAALSYFEKEKHGSGFIDLRGPDAVLVPDL